MIIIHEDLPEQNIPNEIKRTITINGRTIIGYSYEQPTTKQEAYDIIGLERALRQREGGYPVLGNWYHSDYDSKLQQIGLVIMGANIPLGLMWKTLNKTLVPMTPILANAIFQTAAQYELQLFEVAEQKRAQLTDDLTNFDPTTNWPLAYWEIQS